MAEKPLSLAPPASGPGSDKRALVAADARGITFRGADMESMWRFCVAMANSKQFKDIETPEVAFVRLQAGLELGLTPIWSLTNVMVTNGRPAVWGDALLGIVKAHPECDDVIETLEGEGDKTVAVCEVRRRGKVPVIRRFSVEDAKRARLWDAREKVQRKNRNGTGTYEALNDAPWHKYWKRMLAMRARSWACRDAFADALRGFGVIEESRDFQAREEKPISATVLPPMQLPGEATEPEANPSSGVEVETQGGTVQPSPQNEPPEDKRGSNAPPARTPKIKKKAEKHSHETGGASNRENPEPAISGADGEATASGAPTSEEEVPEGYERMPSGELRNIATGEFKF